MVQVGHFLVAFSIVFISLASLSSTEAIDNKQRGRALGSLGGIVNLLRTYSNSKLANFVRNHYKKYKDVIDPNKVREVTELYMEYVESLRAELDMKFDNSCNTEYCKVRQLGKAQFIVRSPGDQKCETTPSYCGIGQLLQEGNQFLQKFVNETTPVCPQGFCRDNVTRIAPPPSSASYNKPLPSVGLLIPILPSVLLLLSFFFSY
ncbi:PREDICTED: uncharacterized protein LOC104605512 isoform X2 [Nelumbo nucifera]|uniref:Uncharacterized protein LOC104605512 isoform X2 n=1 Tax=Nelumbo nucifera TaxID=4432 RepID=A0A1U8ALG5_NELNU|nr:PREDICTED: uncharacterized protein LOC104605512 isoform X2 [Nelumbo nucifera]